MLVGCYLVHPKAAQILDRHVQANDPGYIRSPRLELVWQLVVDRLLKRHGADHVSAALVRRHRFQQVSLAVENSCPGWPVHLVARKYVEVTIQSLYVHCKMRHGLRPIDQHRNISAVRHLDQALERIDRSECVRDVSHGN